MQETTFAPNTRGVSIQRCWSTLWTWPQKWGGWSIEHAHKGVVRGQNTVEREILTTVSFWRFGDLRVNRQNRKRQYYFSLASSRMRTAEWQNGAVQILSAQRLWTACSSYSLHVCFILAVASRSWASQRQRKSRYVWKVLWAPNVTINVMASNAAWNFVSLQWLHAPGCTVSAFTCTTSLATPDTHHM